LKLLFFFDLGIGWLQEVEGSSQDGKDEDET